MRRHSEKSSAGGSIIFLIVLFNAIILERGLVSDPGWYRLAYISFPLLLILIFSSRGRMLKTPRRASNDYPAGK